MLKKTPENKKSHTQPRGLSLWIPFSLTSDLLLALTHYLQSLLPLLHGLQFVVASRYSYRRRASSPRSNNSSESGGFLDPVARRQDLVRNERQSTRHQDQAKATLLRSSGEVNNEGQHDDGIQYVVTSSIQAEATVVEVEQLATTRLAGRPHIYFYCVESTQVGSSVVGFFLVGIISAMNKYILRPSTLRSV